MSQHKQNKYRMQINLKKMKKMILYFSVYTKIYLWEYIVLLV